MICGWCGEPIEEHTGDEATVCLEGMSAIIDEVFFGDGDERAWREEEPVDGPTYRALFTVPEPA